MIRLVACGLALAAAGCSGPGAESHADAKDLWRSELSAWVKARASYPEEARLKGEQGAPNIQVFANPDGHVTSVELQQSSGSKSLDTALVALFTDADLPPFSSATEPITFRYTMHYNLTGTAKR